MTPTELRSHRERLALTQGAAARLIGVDGRTWRRWENAEREIPEPVARLVALMHERRVMAFLAAHSAPQGR